MHRQLILVHLPQKSAEGVTAALTRAFADLPTILRRTLTWDQGSELSDHEQVAAQTGLEVFFCDPASPWQRPTNENADGLLRQYFPKGSDLSVHTAERLELVSVEMNQRPRRVLGWKTPEQLVLSYLGNSAVPSADDPASSPG